MSNLRIIIVKTITSEVKQNFEKKERSENVGNTKEEAVAGMEYGFRVPWGTLGGSFGS